MLKGKVAIVTGPTSGIGLGIAKVSAAIEHLDFKNAVHVGHSTGGGQATVLCGPLFHRGTDTLCWLATRFAPFRRRRFVRSDRCGSRHDCSGSKGIGSR